MVLYTATESSIMVGEQFNARTVVAIDWHDSQHDERVILLVGFGRYDVCIVREAPPNDGTVWEVLYDETFRSIEEAVSGRMTPEPYAYGYRTPREATPWQAGFTDCKERNE